MMNTIPDRPGASASRAWLFLLLGLSVLRLFITGDRDVIALNSPHDEFWYVHRAFIGLTAGSYDQMAFVHSPVYVWWLQSLDAFGVPLRLGIDAALVAAAAYLSIAVRGFTGSRIAALAVAAFLLFHPYTVFLFDRSLAETLLVVAITICLAAGLEVWTLRGTAASARRRLAVVLLPLAFAVAFHIRKEGVTLLAPLLFLACLTWFWRGNWWGRDAHGRLPPGVLLVVSPLAAAMCLGLVISSFNYFQWGTFSRYDLANTGYSDAVSTLTRIDAGQTPNHVSVTREMLAVGYAASPTLKELEPRMEGPVGQQWRDISTHFGEAPGEIADGWFYWALRDVAAQTGWHADARLAEQKYGAVAAELRSAFASGALQERNSLLPSFVDPDFRKWLPVLPASVANIVRISVLPMPYHVAAPTDYATAQQFREYSSVTGRRNPPAAIDISGWVIAPTGTLAGFALGDGEPRWLPISTQARPDVQGAYAIQLTSEGPAQPDRLAFRTPSGSVGHVMITDLQQGKTADTVGEFATTLGVDGLSASTSQRIADPHLGKLVSFARSGGLAFGAFLALALLLAAVQRQIDGLLVVALACILFCATRIVLFAMLDASSWNGLQARYMMPLLPFIAVAGAMGLAYLLRRAKASFPAPSAPGRA